MADEQKPVEVPKDAPVAETPAETKPAEAPAAEDKPAEDKPAETTEAAAATETAAEAAPAAEGKKEEVVPIEEGTLDHKGAGANFPKNLYYSKQPFWFGSDAVEAKSLTSYLKHEKAALVAWHNASWAQHTGKGLLFFGDKSTPTGIINLAEATEPQTDGATKFHFNANGQKHSFKAATKAEAENWISQIKAKINDAKEIAASIKETEAYKAAYEIYKPTVKKDEKKEEAAEEAAAPAEEAKPAEAAAAEETPAEGAKEEPAAEEAKPAEEAPKEEEEPKRRSASRKRTSVLDFFGKKEKKEGKKEETKPAEAAEAAPAEAPAEATEAPAAEEAEPAKEAPKETPKEKHGSVKRNSFFGLIPKKDKKPAEEA